MLLIWRYGVSGRFCTGIGRWRLQDIVGHCRSHAVGLSASLAVWLCSVYWQRHRLFCGMFQYIQADRVHKDRIECLQVKCLKQETCLIFQNTISYYHLRYHKCWQVEWWGVSTEECSSDLHTFAAPHRYRDAFYDDGSYFAHRKWWKVAFAYQFPAGTSHHLRGLGR